MTSTKWMTRTRARQYFSVRLSKLLEMALDSKTHIYYDYRDGSKNIYN